MQLLTAQFSPIVNTEPEEHTTEVPKRELLGTIGGESHRRGSSHDAGYMEGCVGPGEREYDRRSKSGSSTDQGPDQAVYDKHLDAIEEFKGNWDSTGNHTRQSRGRSCNPPGKEKGGQKESCSAFAQAASSARPKESRVKQNV